MSSSYDPAAERPVFIAGSGRCGSTLLQSILNTNPDFVIWGEHNGFLRQVAEAYYQAQHARFPDRENLAETDRVHRLRDPRGWPAWDNRCSEAGFRERFQTFLRSFYADPEGRATRWGFKEIRYPRDSEDRTFPFLFDCFPEARLIVLVREPRATIFSMLSHWGFSDIGDDELDGRILAAAEAWNTQYSLLYTFAQLHPAECVEVRYEDLGSSTTRVGLADFLQTSSFDFDTVMAIVKDAADKSGAAADRIRQRMLDLEPRIECLTQAARGIHGYTGPSLVVDNFDLRKPFGALRTPVILAFTRGSRMPSRENHSTVIALAEFTYNFIDAMHEARNVRCSDGSALQSVQSHSSRGVGLERRVN